EQHRIALCSIDLKFVKPIDSIHRRRAAMNTQDQRILFALLPQPIGLTTKASMSQSTALLYENRSTWRDWLLRRRDKPNGKAKS
ncbi:MAG: hypothetical protein LC776_19020, partial [Acidobacteria bacterium]|nr:hypothetical protein [Acidobacteriota bacterium]